ncbi:hypothetical protein E6C76_07345 [Pseudothauera nasutitermitis]|uniref:Uncharacterized protein n=1 Tax=Pseudothauera nasutitermitis TaxID=2565930 RepID=A0A4S4B4F0_9RHOO|nr:hypothetical protein [Pseudothauera nasutitermitis]THF66630.1 hypothetical protein E6C76_07345 [Pseudothauera nasutitermitis]
MNLYNRLRALIPEPRLEYGTVVATTDTGVLVELPGGARVHARGEAAVDTAVFIRAGVVEGPAPGGLIYTPQTV